MKYKLSFVGSQISAAVGAEVIRVLAGVHAVWEAHAQYTYTVTKDIQLYKIVRDPCIGHTFTATHCYQCDKCLWYYSLGFSTFCE